MTAARTMSPTMACSAAGSMTAASGGGPAAADAVAARPRPRMVRVAVISAAGRLDAAVGVRRLVARVPEAAVAAVERLVAAQRGPAGRVAVRGRAGARPADGVARGMAAPNA